MATSHEKLMQEARGKLSGKAAGTAPGDTAPKVERQTSPNQDPYSPPDEDDFKSPKMTPVWVALHDSLMNIYTSAEMFAFVIGGPDSAQLIGLNKANCVDAWIELAQKDKRVKELLQKLTTGGAWGGVIMAHLPIALALMAKRGILPGGAIFGAFSGEDTQPSAADFVAGPPEDGTVTANGNHIG